MVVAQNTDHAGFVARLNDALDGVPGMPRARGRRVALAKMMGMTGESARKWLAGETLPTMANARRFAEKAGVQVDWLLTGRGPKLPYPPAPDINSQNHLSSSVVVGWEDASHYPREPSEADYASIPQYSVKGSCGNGHLNGHVEVKGGLAFKRDWLARLGVNPDNAAVIYAHGDSMSPTISDGYVVLLDLAQRELRNGLIYAFLAADEVRIKRVFLALSGRWMLSSDNPDKTRYPDEQIDTPGDLTVIGRCVWQGGGL